MCGFASWEVTVIYQLGWSSLRVQSSQPLKLRTGGHCPLLDLRTLAVKWEGPPFSPHPLPQPSILLPVSLRGPEGSRLLLGPLSLAMS